MVTHVHPDIFPTTTNSLCSQESQLNHFDKIDLEKYPNDGADCSTVSKSKSKFPSDSAIDKTENPATMSRAPSPHRRAKITAKKALEIFCLRCFPSDLSHDRLGRFADSTQGMGNSAAISKLYGISPKAVRDVWNGFVSLLSYAGSVLDGAALWALTYTISAAGERGSMPHTISGGVTMIHLGLCQQICSPCMLHLPNHPISVMAH